MKSKERAATVQSRRSKKNPALRRKQLPSVAQLEDRRDKMLYVIDCMGFMFLGAAITYVSLHVVAAIL